MLTSFLQKLWPKFSKEQCVKFAFLAVCYFVLIGAQWPFKTLKDSLLVAEVGADNQPRARAMSVLLCFVLSLVYGQLVNLFKRENVLYLILGVLGVGGIAFYSLIKLYFLGVYPLGKAFVIYGFYIYTDALTVLTIPPFWAFVNDLTTPEEAKTGYGFMVFSGQLGGLFATLVGKYLAGDSSTFSTIALVSTGLLFLLMFTIYMFTKNVSKDVLRGYVADQKKVLEKHRVPFLKGLLLLVASPYVFSLFFITAAQEILTSIMQFKMFKAVEATYLRGAVETISFGFNYSLAIQIVSCITSFSDSVFKFQERLGVEKSVFLYPVLIMIAFLMAKAYPALFMVSACMVVIKGLHYALNKPSREALYIPTTKEVKYKSKAWIDVFGSRLFKLTGTSINKYFFQNVDVCVTLILLSWIPIAGYVGYTYKKSVDENKTVV